MSTQQTLIRPPHSGSTTAVSSVLNRASHAIAYCFPRFSIQQPGLCDIQNAAAQRQYRIGDIILSNGTAVSAANISATQKKDAVSIIFRPATTEQNALGLGIKRGSDIPWCTFQAGAYRTKIVTGNMAAVYDKKRRKTDTFAVISQVLGKADDTDTESLYPAFYFARTYGIDNNLSSIHQNGWYLPSAQELHEMWTSLPLINKALKKLDMPEFAHELYFTSTPSEDFARCAYVFDFDTGKPYVRLKTQAHNVCAVCEF